MLKKSRTTRVSRNSRIDRDPISRRRAVAALAGSAAAVVAGPWLVRNALSSSGEINLFTWGDYTTPEMLADFTAKTGIKVNLATHGSNSEALNKVRAANGEGFDLVQPAIDNAPDWVHWELLQPIDESKVAVERIVPSILEHSKSLGGVIDGKRYALPYDWGTEAITFNTAERSYKYGQLSYGTLWDKDNAGRVVARASSSLVGLGLYLDGTGALPSNRWLDSYKDEASCRRLYEEVLKVAKANKPAIKQFWSDAQSTTNAFVVNGCVIGQTWDGPAMRLRNEGQPYIYMAPKEGALAWMDTMCIPAKAANVEQAYAYINWYLDPAVAGGLFSNATGYNNAVVGSEAHMSEQNKRNFVDAYPGDAIDNLWWWPIAPGWRDDIVTEYVQAFEAA
jgi:spermidine/putrescine transport system substrate-binding protein